MSSAKSKIGVSLLKELKATDNNYCRILVCGIHFIRKHISMDMDRIGQNALS